MSLDDMAYNHMGEITITFDKQGLQRLLDALNDNDRGCSYGLVQQEPGTAVIMEQRLSWAQRLYVKAAQGRN